MHFFLHGWSSSADTEKNKEFFQKLAKYGDTILIFPFGEWPEREEILFERYKENFTRNNPEKTFLFEDASRDIDHLMWQIKIADILFFSGGKPYQHFEIINQIKNLRDVIQDKVIAGVSWWAIMWSTTYYSSSAESLREGNGFIPIKMIAHWRSNKYNPNWLSWEEREKLLDEYGERLPIYKIPEQEFIEMEI